LVALAQQQSAKAMKTIRRLLFRDILSSVAFVALAFLSLFFFIDFVQEIGDLGTRGGYSLLHAFLYCLLQVPGHFYELAPIAVLIGTIYTLARMAQSSEFTILRTAGLGPGRALGLLASLGVAFGLLTFLAGDYVAPATERLGNQVRMSFRGSTELGRSGAWLKDHHPSALGERSYAVHVAGVDAQGELQKVRIFEFDAQGRLVKRTFATSARIDSHALWTLRDVSVSHWPSSDVGQDNAAFANTATSEKVASLQWHSTLSSDVVAAAVMPVNTMSTLELARYVAHLSENEQAAQRHEIQFWKRALYPLACLVMVALALPFAYMHTRGDQGISFKVFGGIMLGISFVLINNLASHLGLLQNWTPWIVAAAPSIFFLLLSMVAFAWLIRYR
jgi:lipopolysaccharide export system permease protein